jgi:hypothetical protein
MGLNWLIPTRAVNRLKSTTLNNGTFLSNSSSSSSRTNSPLNISLSGVISSKNSTPTNRRQQESRASARSSAESVSPPLNSLYRAKAPQSSIERSNDQHYERITARRKEEGEEGEEEEKMKTSSSSFGGGRNRQQQQQHVDDSIEPSTRLLQQEGIKKDDGETSPVEGGGRRDLGGVNLNSLSRFGIPPIPLPSTTSNHRPCNPTVIKKLANFHELLLTRQLHFNDSLSNSKPFRNPRIYSKLVDFLQLKQQQQDNDNDNDSDNYSSTFVGGGETGNCFDKSIWNELEIGKDGKLGSIRLAELQKLKSETKQQQQAAGSRSSINFTSSSRDSRDDRGVKRSRWDNGGKSSSNKSPRRR